MLTDLFFTIVSGIFQTLAIVLSVFNWVIPPAFITALLYLLNYLNYFSGVINLPALGIAMDIVIGFDTLFYGYKIVLFLIHLTPWMGNPSHPKITGNA